MTKKPPNPLAKFHKMPVRHIGGQSYCHSRTVYLSLKKIPAVFVFFCICHKRFTFDATQMMQSASSAGGGNVHPPSVCLSVPLLFDETHFPITFLLLLLVVAVGVLFCFIVCVFFCDDGFRDPS